MKKFIAFSLAEILVTLMIIGVIAGMTIPALRKDAMDRTIATNLKKAYSELNQATALVMTNNEANKLYRTGVLDDQATFDKEFVYKYLNVINECPQGANDDCFGDSSLVSDKSYLLSNGIALSFSGCIGLRDGVCNVFVDVNGPKKPNKGGTDQFLVQMNAMDGRVYLGSADGSRSSSDYNQKCSGDSSSDYDMAWACGAKIQMDGWVIKY